MAYEPDTPSALERAWWVPISVLLLGLAIVASGVLLYSEQDSARIDASWQAQSEQVVAALETEVGRIEQGLAVLAAQIEGNPELSRAQFDGVASAVLAHSGGTVALEWIPRVAGEEADAFLAQTRSHGQPDYELWQRNTSGNREPAGRRDSYFPVLWAFPHQENAAAIGYDLGSDATRREALHAAYMSGRPIATAPISLVQDENEVWAFLVFYPIFDGAPSHDTDMSNLLGFALGVYRVPEVVDAALASFGGRVGLRILDGQQDLVAYPSPEYASRDHTQTLPLYGRTWLLKLHGEPTNPTLVIGGRLLIGFALLAVVLVAWILHLQGREQRAIRGEVQERTRALEETSDQLEEARDRAQAANHAKSEFLAVMSHELRTPLNGILGATALLLDSGLDADQTKLAQSSLSSGNALLELLNDLLDIARIEEGRMMLESIAFDLEPLVEGIVELYRGPAKQRGVDVGYAMDISAPQRVIGDPGRLRQILLNLVGNAVKFTDEGHVMIRVAAQRRNGDEVALNIEVQDTGAGIADEQISQMFDRFTQADASVNRRHGGSGLGLTICRALTDLMEGEIGLRTKLGEGSVFWFTLPMVAVPLDTGTEHASTPPMSGPQRRQNASSNVRILVVDDNEINRMVVCRMLESAGFVVGEAKDGQHAIDMASTQDWSLILMDVQMPGIDGLAAMATIHQLPGPIREVPILALTANARTEDHQRYLDAGMSAVIAKPVRRAAMLDVVLQYLAAETS